MLNVVGSVAQFEREVRLERQREGIAKAKAEGKYKGRAPIARAKADEVRKLAARVCRVRLSRLKSALESPASTASWRALSSEPLRGSVRMV